MAAREADPLASGGFYSNYIRGTALYPDIPTATAITGHDLLKGVGRGVLPAAAIAAYYIPDAKISELAATIDDSHHKVGVTRPVNPLVVRFTTDLVRSTILASGANWVDGANGQYVDEVEPLHTGTKRGRFAELATDPGRLAEFTGQLAIVQNVLLDPKGKPRAAAADYRKRIIGVAAYYNEKINISLADRAAYLRREKEVEMNGARAALTREVRPEVEKALTAAAGSSSIAQSTARKLAHNLTPWEPSGAIIQEYFGQ